MAPPPPLLDALRSLLDETGPFASVYLPPRTITADALEQLDRRWQQARRALTEAGAPTALLEALQAPATVDHCAGEIHCLVATPTGDGSWRIALDTWMRGDLADPVTRLGPVPYLVPLLDGRRREVAHLTVLIDRVGADMAGSAITGAATLVADTVEVQMDGETDDIARSAPGGWSQRRFQQRAENTWEDNARAVAGEVAELASTVDARFVAVAGDVRATAFLVEHLPEAVADRVVLVEGSRHDHDAVADQVERIVADHVARRSVAVLEDLGAHVAAGRGTTDRAAVLEGLRRHRVATLVVATGAAADHTERTAHLSPFDRSQVALDAADLVDAGAGAVRADLDDAAVAAALVSGADVVVVPAATRLLDGLGAIFRF